MQNQSSFYNFSKNYYQLYAASYDALTLLSGYSRAPYAIVRELNKIPGAIRPDAKILDFGCGTGRLTRELVDAHDGLNITGMDPNGEMLEKYRKKFSGADNIKYIVGGYEHKLSLADNSYDLVVSSGVFGHLLIDAGLIREFLRVIRPGGYLAFNYERHKDASIRKAVSCHDRIFYTHADNYIRQCVEEAGATVAAQKQDRFGYFIHVDGFFMRHMGFSTLIARKAL